MKVLHVNEHLAHKGGVETYLLSLLPMLRERGVEAGFVYDAGDGDLFRPSMRVEGLQQAAFGAEAAARQQMAAVLERERPDVVHLHNFQNVGVVEACLDYGPTVMTTHDYRSVCPANSFFYKRTQEVCGRDCAGPGCFTTTLRKHCVTPRPRYAAYFYHRVKWLARNAGRFAHVIAPSAGARDRLVRARFAAPHVSVLPYFCPVAPAARPRPLPEATTITFMGRIAPNKGHEFFVQALGLLPADVAGVMVGSFNDENERYIRQLAAAHGCERRLTLRKWATRQEVQAILDETSVFVFPSLWPETLGIVGLEALARGVPVVASDLGGVREWLRDRENGVLVQPKSPAQIADAVRFLTETPERLQAFGMRAIETINERFLPAHHADELVRLYHHVAARKSPVGTEA